MAIGEWLSVQSARELYTHQIAVERDELISAPEEEEEELALIYEAKGLSAAQARTTAHSIVAGDAGHALDTLAREELGIDPDALGGSAWVAAEPRSASLRSVPPSRSCRSSSRSGQPAIVASVAVSVLALMAVGAAITVVTGASALRTGARQVVLGLAAAAITFGLAA